MKNFCKKIAIFLGIVAAVSATSTITSVTPVSAREFGSCDTSFAGLTPWDCNVGEMNSEDSLKTGIAQIATNILTDLTVIASYLILGYVIYGGFLYMSSSGDPGKTMTAKKTLTHAFIGLAITVSAFTIFSGIRVALAGNQALNCDQLTGTGCVDGGAMVTNIIQWIGGIAGAIAVIFVVVGAWGYITANGDPGKLQKAKTTILYALIGLVVVALAEVLTAFVSNLVRKSTNQLDHIKNPSIVKEIANLNKEENDKI